MDVRDLLKKYGPSLSSELIALMKDSGVSDAAARQRITRSLHDCKRLAGLRFAKNARFFYLEDQYATPAFWSGLERAFRSSGVSYWGAVVGLAARGGRCPSDMFPIVCGAPRARSRQLSPQRVFERMKAINFLQEERDAEANISYISFRTNRHVDSVEVTRARNVAERVALQAIVNWSRKIGLGSYNTYRTRGGTELPEVAGVAWDLSAPSYIRPLASAYDGPIKPGFFVCDLSLLGPITTDFVELFVRKHDMASAPKNVAPILPMLVGQVFTQSAFDAARRSGIVAATIEDLFGKEVAKALQDLIKLLSDTGATAAVNPEHLENVLNALTTIEGAERNVRSALFELVIGSLVKEVYGGFLQTGRIIRDNKSAASSEIDVLLYDEPKDRLLIIECKAKTPGSYVSEAEVKHWYQNRLPLRERLLRTETRYIGSAIHFELWTNGELVDSASAWLKTQAKALPEYTVDWKDGAEIKKIADLAPPESSVKKMLREHYFNHPLSKARRRRPKTSVAAFLSAETGRVARRRGRDKPTKKSTRGG